MFQDTYRLGGLRTEGEWRLDMSERLRESGVSRRDFLKGTAALGAIAAGSAIVAGCSSKPTNSNATAKQSEADPIPPVAPPKSWDQEADIVVIGTGGGGLAASALAAQGKASVITLEKSSDVGGSTQHAAVLVCYGGTRYQNAIQFAVPSFPFDPKAVVSMLWGDYQFTPYEPLLVALATQGPKCIDWMGDLGVPWDFDPGYGPAVLCWKGETAGGFYGSASKKTVAFMYEKAKEFGAKFLVSTKAETLVRDDSGRIIGVKATGKDGASLYVHAKKAVIMTAGGYSQNRDMQEKYAPSLFKGATAAFTNTTDTGDCIRMGLGAGADFAGLDSWVCFDGGLDDYAYGTGPFAHGFYQGDNILVRQPWLSIDRNGARYRYQNGTSPTGPSGTAATQMSRVGHRGYVIFDNNWEKLTPNFNAGRATWTPDTPNVDRIEGSPKDWVTGANAGIKRGAIKKSDTVEGLAKELGLEPEVLTAAVDNWNQICANGEDPEYGYLPAWLIPIKDAPFFGARVGGQIESTKGGVRVNEKMQVLNEQGEVISGLYAGFHTAGGAIGESSYSGGAAGGSLLGSQCLSWASGYMAAENALNE